MLWFEDADDLESATPARDILVNVPQISGLEFLVQQPWTALLLFISVLSFAAFFVC